MNSAPTSSAPIDVTMQLTAEDWQDGFALVYRRRRKIWRIIVVALLPFLALPYGWYLGDMTVGWIVFAITALCSVWLLAFATRCLSGVQARRMLRNMPAMREKVSYRFNEDGLTVAVADQAAGGLPWRLIIGYSQDEKVLILYDAPMRIRAFPRRLVSDQDLAGIVALAEKAGQPRR